MVSLPWPSSDSVIMLVYAAVVFLVPVVLAQNQGLYKMWLEGLKPCRTDEDLLMDVSSIKVSHYNRTSLVIQGTLNLHKTIDEGTNMRMVAYKKSTHGSWTKTLVDTQVVKLCDHIKTDEHFWPPFVNISDLPARCPLTKGEYHFREASLTFKQLPPMVPLGCYRLTIELFNGNMTSCNYVYVKVTGPRESSKPRCSP